MVQNMGNTLQVCVAFKNVMDAMERDSKDGPKNGVCDEGVSAPELSGVVPGVWDQRKDWLQVA
jgi:hypothetical protein